MNLPPEEVLKRVAACLVIGMDIREAAIQVGEELIFAAAMKATDIETGRRLIAVLATKGRMDSDDRDMEQAVELTSAGWTSIDPRPANLPAPRNVWEKTPVMGWQWRRPGRRPDKPGRLFHSTNQAWRALKREQSQTNESP